MSKKCLLCKTNNADKSGSHIVPSFLLKRIENIIGKNKRDYEIGFQINVDDIKSHFGREVNEVKLEEIFGEISEDLITKNKHPLIEDYLFCTECENRLGKVESTYSTSLNKFAPKQYKSGINSGISLLFWMSIVWRLSIIMHGSFQLTKNHEEISRRILNKFLREDLQQIDLVSLSKDKLAKKITYKILRAPNFPRENGACLLIHPSFKYPYSILIGEYLLLFSFSNNHNIYQNHDFFGLQLPINDAIKNNVIGKEIISYMSNDEMLMILNNIRNISAEQLANNFNQYLDEFHVLAGGYGNSMSLNLKHEIFNELSKYDKPLGVKFTFDDFKAAILTVLKKNNLIN